MCAWSPPMCRRRLKFLSLLGLFVWLSTNALKADEIVASPEASSQLIRWAITQGGPSVLVIVIGWSYRRDLLGVIVRKNEEIAAQWEQNKLIVEMVRQTAQTNERLTAAVEALTVEVRRLDAK